MVNFNNNVSLIFFDLSGGYGQFQQQHDMSLMNSNLSVWHGQFQYFILLWPWQIIVYLPLLFPSRSNRSLKYQPTYLSLSSYLRLFSTYVSGYSSTCVRPKINLQMKIFGQFRLEINLHGDIQTLVDLRPDHGEYQPGSS